LNKYKPQRRRDKTLRLPVSVVNGCLKLLRHLKAQVCDATEAEKCFIAGLKKILLIVLLYKLYKQKNPVNRAFLFIRDFYYSVSGTGILSHISSPSLSIGNSLKRS